MQLCACLSCVHAVVTIMSSASRAAGRGRRGGAQDSENGTKTSLGAGVAQVGGGIFKSAAVAVLRQERKLMTTGDITRVALERGLINCQGKTPEATMASALYTDVKRKHNKSVFTRPQEGLFGLREWIAEGFYPEGWSAPADSEGVAPFKRRGGAKAQSSQQVPAASGARGTRRSGLGRASKKRAAAVWRRAAGSESDTTESEPDDDAAEDDEDEEDDGTGADEPMEDMEDGEALGEGQESEDPRDSRAPGVAAEASSAEEDRRDRILSPTVRRPRRSAADTTYVTGAPVRRESRDGRASSHGGAGPPHANIPDLGSLPPNDMDLDSPLHVLGDVALLSEQVERQQQQLQQQAQQIEELTSSGKRRRGSIPLHIQVPTQHMGEGPKSPYEDKLAALHEIASASSGLPSGGKRRRNGSVSPMDPLMQGDLQGPGQTMHADGFLAGLHLPSPVLSSGRGRRRTNTQFIHPLPSPGGGLLDHGLLNGIGDLPSANGDVAQGGLLFSPTMLQHLNHSTPRIGGTSSHGHKDGNPFRMEADSGHGYEGLLPGLGPYIPNGPQAFAGPDMDSTPEERMADAEGLQAVVTRLEARLGRTNPVTAKSWLALAKVFHSLVPALGPPAAARALSALQHALQVAEEAASALGTQFQGTPLVQELAKSLGGTVTPASMGAVQLGPGLPAALPAALPLQASLPGSLPATLTTLPAASVLPANGGPPLTMGTSGPGSSAVNSTVVLPVGAPATTGATMQVIPAAVAPAPATVAPVLNLGAGREEPGRTGSGPLAPGALGSGVTKLVLPPAPIAFQLGVADGTMQLASGTLVLGVPAQGLQGDGGTGGKDLMTPAAPVLAHA